jgi:nicotinamidase-related amidase
MKSRTSTLTLCSAAGFAVTALLLGANFSSDAQAQPAAGKARAPIAGLSRQPSPAAADVLLDPSDTVVLLLDHQTGLFQTVKDVPVAELRSNTVALANIARLGKAPIIYTASEPNGPNGPLMDEISSWDNAEFVKAVEATGRKTLVIAGVWTSVCVAFPALQAKADGYKVYFVTDASGDPSVMASQTTVARLTAAGIIPVSTNAVLCEFQRTWNRPDAGEWGAIYGQLVPHYKAVAESYQRAQEAAKPGK